jgi:hypothetical protein
LTKARFKIIVSTETNPSVEIPFHYQRLSKAVETARLYKKTPLVRSVVIMDEFEEFWSWTPDKGEKEMSRFATLIQESQGNWVNSTAKKLLAAHRIPFTVTKVSDLTWNKNFRVDEWNLQILFTPSQVAEYPELREEMTLTLSSAPKAQREDRIRALKEDTEEGLTVSGVILTYDETVGRNGWYDLGMVAQPEMAVAD